MSTEPVDFNTLVASLGSNGDALKSLIYGTAGAGKSANIVSVLAPYLSEGYDVIWVATEDNSLAGLKDGLMIYKSLLSQILTPGRLFLADLRKTIAGYNKAYAGNVKDLSQTMLAPGGPLALFSFLTEQPKVVDFFAQSEAPKNFKNMSNLTALTPSDKVLIIIDGLSRIDANTAGFAFKARQLRALETSAFAIAMLQKGGITALQDVLSGLTTDVICLAHDALGSIDLTDAIKDTEKKDEAKERRTLQEQQMQNAFGFPAIATTSTRSAFIGNFSLVLHAVDTRLADSRARTRFSYDYTPVADSTTWYTRTNLTFVDAVKKFAQQRNCLPFVPQNWTSSLLLTYLHGMNRLSGDNLDKLLTLTKQTRL